METSLSKLKNHYAKEQGYEDWTELVIFNELNADKLDRHCTAICILAQKAYGEKIKESVSIFIESDLTVNDIFIDDYVNIISKITNPKNLIR